MGENEATGATLVVNTIISSLETFKIYILKALSKKLMIFWIRPHLHTNWPQAFFLQFLHYHYLQCRQEHWLPDKFLHYMQKIQKNERIQKEIYNMLVACCLFSFTVTTIRQFFLISTSQQTSHSRFSNSITTPYLKKQIGWRNNLFALESSFC